MIPGSNQSPYREPCGGSVLCGNGSRYRHGRSDENNIPVYLYDAVVDNFDTEVGGTIAPYERYVDNSAGTCEMDGCVVGGAPCDAWIGNGSDQFNLTTPPPTPVYYQPQMLVEVTIDDAGSGYVVGDLLSPFGGVGSSYIAPDGSSNYVATIRVTGVNGTGGITSVAVEFGGSYKTPPTSPNSVQFGTGSGATVSMTFAGQTEDLSVCHKYGFKNVQAMRQWHGTPGYFFDGPIDIYTCNNDTYGDNCTQNQYIPYNATAAQTKYCDVSYEISGSWGGGFDCLGEPDNTFLTLGSPIDDSYSADISVDPLSGVVTVNDGDYGCGAAQQFSEFIGYDLGDWINRFTNMTAITTPAVLPLINEPPYGDYFGPQDPPGTGFSLSCAGSGYSFETTDGSYPNQTGSGTWAFGSGSFEATRTYTTTDEGDGGVFTGESETESVTVTDSSVNYSYEMQSLNTASSPDWVTNYNVTLTITLGTPNTAADVLADMNTLLDEWDLTDDTVYPWRTDDNTSMAPLVARNEVPENISPKDFTPFTTSDTQIDDCFGLPPSDPDYLNTCEHPMAIDPNANIYDGSIIGAPLPAGYQGWFDFYYNDWRTCSNDGGETYIGYQLGWGNFNTGNQQYGIPRTATHWTSQNLGWQFPGGAWIFYNHNPSWMECNTDLTIAYKFSPTMALIAQKWAETKMGFPSQNFFRPAGDDKFSLDEGNVYGINSVNTTNGVTDVYLITTTGCVAANANASTGSGIWGGASVDGFFEVSGNGNPFTLGTKMFDLPSDWQSASGDTDDCFGLLRFPNAFPILGLAGVSNIANTGPVELTTDSLPNLGMGIANANADHIDIFDNDLVMLSANQQVTRIDDSHFTVPTSFATIQNAAHIMSNGAPAYYWDDQYPKGDYVYTDWYWWPRVRCEALRWNDWVAGCPYDGATCDCPSTDAQTVYCQPFFNPVVDDAGTFTHAFTQEANCVPFNPCSPSVLCISPNGESFPVGVTYDFPTIYLDEQYGSGWQAEIQQVMQDLLYQTPHYPAVAMGDCEPTPFQWIEDSGSCSSDVDGTPSQRFYPHAPMVEARITLPSGAPDLPSEITIGWDSPAGAVDSGDCSSYAANTLFPANANGYLLGVNTLWGLWSNECGCINLSERFADIYENDILGCQ